MVFLSQTVAEGRDIADPKAEALVQAVRDNLAAPVPALAQHIGLGDAPQGWTRAIARAVADYPTNS